MKSWMIPGVILVICLAGRVNAYETPTHSDMTDSAINRSVLVTDPDLLEQLGLTGGIETNTFPAVVPSSEESPQADATFTKLDAAIPRIIKGGAVLEDGATNSLHHFYDPVHGGRGLAPVLSIPIGKSSPDWILAMDSKDDGTSTYFYGDTLDYFYLALTSNQKFIRDIYFGRMFRGIGHLVHHIQDMAQPQHVRNDQHCDGSVVLVCKLVNNPSLYEKYTDKFRKTIIASANTYPVPEFPVAKQFWNNSEGTGMAEFTVSNFVSQGTNFELNSKGVPKNDSRYLLPSPLPEEFMTTSDLTILLQQEGVEQDELTEIVEELGCDEPKVCKIDFIASRVVDKALSGFENTIVNYRSSTISMLDDELKKRNKGDTVTTTYNRFNFHAAYRFLISRAIAYSAGLINHFFRGRLSLEEDGSDPDGNVILSVANTSRSRAVFKSGKFEIYYDSKAQGRKLVPNYRISGGSLPLRPDDKLKMTMTVPEDVDDTQIKPYLLVFNARHGNLGEEVGIAATRFKVAVPGNVSRLRRAGGEICPGLIYGVSITFEQQPRNNGRVVLKGLLSGAVFDFSAIPASEQIFRHEARWRHMIDEDSGKYTYEVTYRYPGTETDPCTAPTLGPWIQDEIVKVEVIE